MIANLISISRLGGSPEPKYPPIADFSSTKTEVAEGGNTLYFSTSTVPPEGPPITTYEWNFEGGNPSTSTATGLINVYYDTPGTYDVSLKVTNADGDNTKLVQDYITVLPVTNIEPKQSWALYSGLSANNMVIEDWSGVRFNLTTAQL
jgi:PKD repeat protein